MATQTVQTVSDIPAALAPFFTKEDTGLIPRGTAEIFRPFEQRYDPLISAGLVGAGTVAPLSAMQQRVGTRLEGLGLPGAFTQAQQAGQTALGSFGDISNVTAPGLQQFQLDPARQFSAEEMQTYMSPYMQGVVDVQQRKAIEDAQRAQLGQNLAAARQGTYGGARQTLAQAQREAGLRTQLGDIQAQGLQSAFQQAQQQFGADRTAQMAAEQENLRAALGIQQLGAGQSLEAQRVNQQRSFKALKVLRVLLKHWVVWARSSLPVNLILRRPLVLTATFKGHRLNKSLMLDGNTHNNKRSMALVKWAIFPIFFVVSRLQTQLRQQQHPRRPSHLSLRALGLRVLGFIIS
jgi:hypothetical protein